MGWKSTTTIKRNDALALIVMKLYNSTDSELIDVLNALGFGENNNLPYYGYDFIIED